MSDRYFVDTNILMYAHDSAAGEKHARAKALVQRAARVAQQERCTRAGRRAARHDVRRDVRPVTLGRRAGQRDSVRNRRAVRVPQEKQDRVKAGGDQLVQANGAATCFQRTGVPDASRCT